MEFICENCKEKFDGTRSEQECSYEKDILFPGEKDLAVVCEPCFIEIMDFNERTLKRYAPFIDIKNMDA